MHEHKYCSTTGINKETLDLLNLDFLHFLLHSVKDLYLTQRQSCWKRAKAFFSLCFFSPFLKRGKVQQRLMKGGREVEISIVTFNLNRSIHLKGYTTSGWTQPAYLLAHSSSACRECDFQLVQNLSQDQDVSISQFYSFPPFRLFPGRELQNNCTKNQREENSIK